MEMSKILKPLKSLIPAIWPTWQGEEEGQGRDVRPVLGGLLVAAIIGWFLIIWHDGRSKASTPLLWSLACLASGGMVGFLFGIPKIMQGELPPRKPATPPPGELGGPPPVGHEAEYRQQVNTNLEQISDWLTKIIVGLGLVELKNVPEHLKAAAESLATDLGQPTDRSYAGALIVYFTVMGFLYGYLATRLFLAGAFSRADRDAIEGNVQQIRDQLVQVKQVAEDAKNIAIKGTGDGGLPLRNPNP